MDATSQPPTEIFKALSDPVRWSIVMQMAAVDELACVTLEDTLTVSKPTISTIQRRVWPPNATRE